MHPFFVTVGGYDIPDRIYPVLGFVIPRPGK